jgi:DNA-binding CsgD family transcriptional regulator
MAPEIVARDAELDAVRSFVERTDRGFAALVLEGEPGIGKSTLWLAAVEHAKARGISVLTARPAEPERALALGALGDLFEGVLEDVAPALSPPRRRALETALLLAEADDSVDQRALAVAVRDALNLLGLRGPVLVAVDDAQWLDGSTAGVLAFALRRLEESSVRLFLARRMEPTELEDALAGRAVERVLVTPLSVGALHRVLHDQLGKQFARQTLLRIHERSGGNPFFALELARALDADVGPLDPLPLPGTLHELVRERLAGLPDATREALALASALGAPTESLLDRVGITPASLEPAVEARVIERDRGTIRFTHPLLSSALYDDLGAGRRKVHERIAAAADDPVLRARHLALATDEPDASVAEALAVAATTAADRGASAGAAELAEGAWRRTPAGDTSGRCVRALAAARAHRAAGEWTRARAILNDLLEEPGIGAVRAEALALLAELVGLERGTTLLEEALREASSRPALQAAIQCRLAWTARFAKGFDGALEHARAALRLAEAVDDDALRIDALDMMVFLGLAVGDPEAPAHAKRASSIAVATGDADLLRRARLMELDTIEKKDHGAARALLEREYEASRDRNELSAAEALYGLAWVELAAGNWERAADYAERTYELMTQYGLEVPWAHLPIAMVAAYRGRLELARTHSERALELGEAQFGRHTPVHLGTLGLVAWQAGDPQTALRWFGEAEAVTTRLGWRNANHRWWIADHVEVLLELDRVDEAVSVLDAWEDERRPNDDWTLAHVVRCRGLVEAARGDVGAAVALLEDAADRHEATEDPFGRARALLALGVVSRRRRQKRAAREGIEAALAAFEDLGAATWVDRSRAELGRIGGRVREEGLTAAERRVAALVAEGRTNREVAAALFLGERTVETHLSHVYAKLGIRSRAELARVYRPAEQSSGDLTISS